jgi:hypothetical protein
VIALSDIQAACARNGLVAIGAGSLVWGYTLKDFPVCGSSVVFAFCTEFMRVPENAVALGQAITGLKQGR